MKETYREAKTRLQAERRRDDIVEVVLGAITLIGLFATTITLFVL